MKGIGILCVCALLVHCASAGQGNDNPVSRAANEFSLRLLQELTKRSGSSNVLVSGFSAHTALAVLHQGAGGESARELAKLLRLHNDNANINNAYQTLLNSMQNEESLNLVNNIYPSNRLQVKQNFISQARQNFLAAVKPLNYGNPSQAASQINQDVEQATKNKIRNLVNPSALNENTVLTIVNAIHFKAAWQNQFNRAYPGDFHVSSSQKVRAEMLKQQNDFEYKEDSGLDAKILKMNYDQNQANGFSMLFILPKRQNAISSLESKLANASPDNLFEGFRSTQVEVTIPKFKIEKPVDLKDIFQQMGVSNIFSSEANFQKISEHEVKVSKILQKNVINVDENGTEAAAGTHVGGVPTSARPPANTHFRADHPFFFAIARQGTILFVGKLVNPSSN